MFVRLELAELDLNLSVEPSRCRSPSEDEIDFIDIEESAVRIPPFSKNSNLA
jgi:hypothetical protein